MSGRDDLICSIPRSRGAVQVRLREYKGTEFTDVRAWYFDEHTNELKPGKGCTVRPSELREVAAGLLKAAETLEAEAAG